MLLALILYPAAIIAPVPTYRGHEACITAGRVAVMRGEARAWACVSLKERRP